MRLYLSSFRNGDAPEELLKLLAKGRRTALVCNAVDFETAAERQRKLQEETERLRAIGLDPSEVDLRDYFGKPEALRKELSKFDLIWVRGGNVFILLRAFKQSGADKVIAELLAKDKLVYGGYSAGAVVLCPTMHGVDLVDDPTVVPTGYNPEIIWEGLGIMPKMIVPHYKSDHPESAATDRTVQYLEHKNIPFTTLRDGEAIVVDGHTERVVGKRP